MSHCRSPRPWWLRHNNEMIESDIECTHMYTGSQGLLNSFIRV